MKRKNNHDILSHIIYIYMCVYYIYIYIHIQGRKINLTPIKMRINYFLKLINKNNENKKMVKHLLIPGE